MILTGRKAANAALVGAAAAATYLFGAEVSKTRPVRGGALFLLASAAMSGIVAGRGMSKAYNTEHRFNNLLNNGGHFGGNVTVAGDHTVTGQLRGSGGTIDVADNINMQAGDLTTVSHLNGNGTQVAANNGMSMFDSLIMNSQSAFTFGHITSNQIGPGTDRAPLGGGATLAQVQARCDYLLGVLESAGICY